MNLVIKNFNTHKTALTIASVFALSSFLFLFPFMLISLLMPMSMHEGNTAHMTMPFLWMTLILPLFYFIFAYLGIRFSSWVYNRISPLTGGIVMRVEQLDE